MAPKAELGIVRAEIGSASQLQQSAPPQHSLEGLAAESSIHTSANKQVSGTSAVRAPSVKSSLSSDWIIKQEKAKGSSSSPVDEAKVADGVPLQKKVKKRKPEVDLNEMPHHVDKPPSQPGDERLNLNLVRPSASVPHKPSLKQNSGTTNFEQSS